MCNEVRTVMLEDKVREIVDALKKSREFRILQQAHENLEKNSQYKRRVEKFMQDNAMLCRQSGGVGQSFQEDLERNYLEMMQVPELAAYFKAVEQFNHKVEQLQQHMYDLIEQALEEKTNSCR